MVISMLGAGRSKGNKQPRNYLSRFKNDDVHVEYVGSTSPINIDINSARVLRFVRYHPKSSSTFNVFSSTARDK